MPVNIPDTICSKFDKEALTRIDYFSASSRIHLVLELVRLINQSPKQDRDKDEVYLKTSPSQSSAYGVSHDLGSVLAHAGVARQQPGLYRNKVTTCIL